MTLILLAVNVLIFSFPLNNIKTDDMNLIYYSNSHSYIIPHISRCYLRTWDYYKDFWKYKPYEKTSIFIEDFSDWSNGGATAVTNNFVYISMSPYMYVFEVAPAAERMSLLMHHELTHVLAMDMYSPQDYFFRKLFRSKIQHTADDPITFLYGYLTNPRKYAPRWYHEGIAVSMETWMGGGIGRAMGAYDEMVFRGMIKDDAHFYRMVGLEAEGTAIDFQVGANSYMYGTRFFGYLAYMYGPDKLVEWVKRDKESKGFYASQFTKVYNKNLSEEWDRWIEFEREFQLMNLQRIRQNPVTDFRPVNGSKPMGSVSRSYLSKDRKKLFVGVKYAGQLPGLMEIDLESGKKRKICNIKGASTYFTTNPVYIEDENRIIFTTDNFYRRDLNTVDISTGKTELLIRDSRTGELALNKVDKSIWGIRHENGISTIVKIDPPYKDWTAIYAFEYGSDLYDLDISPDGTKLTGALTQIDGNQKLVYYDMAALQSGKVVENLIYDFDYSSPANFVFSDDGRYLFGTSYYSGVSNIYRYDFEENDISIISNSETGFFRPLPISNDSLIVYNYVGGKGWQPGFIKNENVENVSAIAFLGQKVYEKYPYIKEWGDGSPAKINLDSLKTYEGKYSYIRNFRNKGTYPIIEGYKDYMAYGYLMNYSDDIGFNSIKLSVSYSPIGDNLKDEEKLHLGCRYSYRMFNLRGTYNKADFYDIFGPVKVSRKGYSYGAGFTQSLIYNKPEMMNLSLDFDGYGDLKKLPEYQKIGSDFTEMYVAAAKLDYKFFQNSLGHVDDEQGAAFSVNVQGTKVNSDIHPKIHGDFSLGYLLPVKHTSIFLRSAAGYAFGDRKDSFSNYYFGGFGNNYVEKKHEKQYRKYSSFPGFDINEIKGKSFVRNMLELNLPPLRFEEIGNAAFYMRWLRMSLFGSIIHTDIDNDDKAYYYNAGTQIDLRVVTLSFIKTTFSIGYSTGWDRDSNREEEIMFSLKIL